MINTSNGNRNKDYYLVNILNHLNVIDYKNSVIEFYGNTDVIKRVVRLAFNEDDISKNIFRLGNLELQIWVSNDLKEELTRSNISGIDFIPLDEFTEEE